MALTSPQPATSIVLKIPEILELIASFLYEKKHLATCVRVCKAWHEGFSTALHHILRICPNSTDNAIAAGIKNAAHVREIDLWTDRVESLYPLPFNRLRTLHITHRHFYLKDENFVISQVADFILKNSNTLLDIMFCRLDEPSTSAIWKAISGCPVIDRVRFHRSTVRGTDMERFLDAVSNARYLTFTHADIAFSSIKPPPTGASPPRLLNLQYLEIFRTSGIGNGGFTGIIQHAPNLRTLKLDPDLVPVTVPYAYQLAISLKGCRNLKDVVLDHMILSGEGNAMILDSVTDAKTLNWSVDGFSEQAIGSLMSRHSRTITDLRLTGTTGLTSRMTQTIMTGCPLLEYLALSTISGTDLVRIAKVDQGNQDSCKNTEQVIVGEDWICLGLTTLSLQFDLGSKKIDIDRDTPEGEAMFQRQQRLEQYHAFRQIGRLTHLENLYISRDASDARNERTLDLRLQANGGGLEGMTALKNLRRFDFDNTKQDLSEEEIDWMVSQWPRLNTLSGTYHSDEAKCLDLRRYFWKQLQERR